MAQTLGYDTYNITVDQATLLYNVIRPILDRELDVDSLFVGVDTSEI
jgi:hypothetical protein